MFEQQWLEVDSGNRKLRVGVREGTGQGQAEHRPRSHRPTIILLHGVTRCWRDFEPVVPFLSHDWTIFGLDHRGHGDSDRADRYLVADYASDLIELLEKKSFGNSVVLVGHSLGAMVAAIAASKVPELVRAVVLEDPPFETMGASIRGTTWQRLFEGMLSVCAQGGSIDQISQRLGSIKLPQADGTSVELKQLRTDEALRWGASCLSRLDPRVLDPLISGRWLEGLDWSSVAQGIRCPAVLLQADFGAGGALSDSDAKSFSEACQGSEWIRFPGKNHQLHGTIPGEIASVVNRFLTE
ncbi:MAG: alpha/beta fold hydrolase [Pirellula sp.]